MATTHIVEQGEYLSLIAKRHGFVDWKLIWNHPKNAALRKKHPNPNVIHPGDKIHIPDRQPKEVACATTKVHRFEVKSPGRMLIRIVLRNHDGEPLANQPYVLTVGEAVFKKNTNPDGMLEHWVPVGEETGELTLEQFGLRWPVHVGNLDPLKDEDDGSLVVTGVQARLNNLGFPCGPVDGIVGPRTTAALKKFQKMMLKREDADGALDGDTIDALLGRHAT